jgi:hypothetical protein
LQIGLVSKRTGECVDPDVIDQVSTLPNGIYCDRHCIAYKSDLLIVDKRIDSDRDVQNLEDLNSIEGLDRMYGLRGRIF